MLTVDVHTHFVPIGVLTAARRGAGFDGMTAQRSGGRSGWSTAALFGLNSPGP